VTATATATLLYRPAREFASRRFIYHWLEAFAFVAHVGAQHAAKALSDSDGSVKAALSEFVPAGDIDDVVETVAAHGERQRLATIAARERDVELARLELERWQRLCGGDGDV
jgi:hypothetical protein